MSKHHVVVLKIIAGQLTVTAAASGYGLSSQYLHGGFWEGSTRYAHDMDASVVVNVVLLVVTAGAMVAAFWQAAEARKARIAAQVAEAGSEGARDEARRLSEEANAAFLRQAEAQERANALAEAALPREEVEWKLEKTEDHSWVLSNTGRAIAEALDIETLAGTVWYRDDLPRDVTPGDNVSIFTRRAMGMPVCRMRFRWTENGEEHENEVNLP